MAGKFIDSKPIVVNVGVDTFGDAIKEAGSDSVQVDWRPPAKGDAELNSILLALEDYYDEISEANEKAIEKILTAQPVWIDVGSALDVIPGFTADTVLHAGPPVTWENMCGPMKGGVIGALIFEGRAKDKDEAIALAETGTLKFSPCHHFNAVGPMSGIITASMPIIVVENKTDGNLAYSNFNSEKNRKALSFGAFDQDIQDVLIWQRDIMGPMLGKAVRKMGGVDLKAITARALQMGDEGHNRHVASTSLLLREMLPTLARLDLPREQLAELADYMQHNDWFFLNFSMAACKATMDAGHDIPMSTIVTAMARNGVESGIRVSGLGKQWFTAPAPPIRGLMFSPFTEKDANPDLGDSTITETSGIGAFAMAAAPAMVKLVGGTVSDANEFTKTMAEITIAENKAYTIPALDFLGTPTGIDIRKVVDTGIHPKINTGIAHRQLGYGIVGAGITEIPMECFVAALKALYQSI